MKEEWADINEELHQLRDENAAIKAWALKMDAENDKLRAENERLTNELEQVKEIANLK